MSVKMSWTYSSYSKIDEKSQKYFPFEKPRQYQLETISEIMEAIKKGYKYIVLEAGTGTGKSAIAATLAQIFDSSYILTITKQLQDQYLNDFKDLGFKLVKGRSNFQCKKYLEDGVHQSCDLGRCVIEGYKCKYSLNNHSNNKITKENTCEYYFQKFQAMNSQVTIANYPYMFLELNYVDDFFKRELMICDEAHNIESMIMNQLTLEFERNDLKEYLKVNLSKELVNQLNEGDYNDWIHFITKIKTKYEQELSKIENLNKPELSEKIMFIKMQINDCRRFLDQINIDPSMWIFDYDKNNKIAQFKPLKIDTYAKNTLFRYGEVCLFMSATILDYRLFAHWLGISPDEIYAIRRKSPFDIKRNPIKTYSGFNMSKDHLKDSAPRTINTIRDILDKHKNEKGIIHTISGQCRDFLISNIKTDRFIFHDTKDRSEIIDEFKKSKQPLVLVSPSVNEGVDLPGDECRFQIIYKIPYPDLGDKQTALRAQIDPKWYNYKTSLALVQTHGRGMRYNEDFCRTYFIDSRFISYVFDNPFIPESFKRAIDEYVRINTSDEIIEDALFKRKYELIRKGKALSDKDDYENAIKFYKTLLHDDLFANDYYPYLELAEAYDKLDMYEEETKTIIEFFKSGIYATENVIDNFKKRLKLLDGRGYFDCESQMSNLESEFMKKRSMAKRNQSASNVPLADKIINITRD
ncbi:helicase C-terminal domain-containing protein [Methanobrevibacter sp.]|uniref:helicase C-terminal domain-containing protein n=1 Tax=Methanobrevibacter sp. TaxID=66852 RepID=UPI00389030FB